jgi:uncharacterized protein
MESLENRPATDAELIPALEVETNPPVAVDPRYPSILQSIGILLIIIGTSIGCVPLLFLSGTLNGEVFMMLCYVTTMGLSFAIVHSLRRRKLGVSNYDFRINSWKLVLPLVLTSIALLLGVIGPITSLIPMPESTAEGLNLMMTQTGWATLVYFVIGAPVLEELIFRGIILDGYLKRYQPTTAIIVSSLLFGAFHFNPWQFVTGTVLGCFLGWVYYRTRSVGPCILVHMAANFCGYLVRLVFSSTEFAQQVDLANTERISGSYLVFSAICLVIIVASILYLRKEFNRLDLLHNAGDAPAV